LEHFFSGDKVSNCRIAAAGGWWLVAGGWWLVAGGLVAWWPGAGLVRAWCGPGAGLVRDSVF